MPFFRLHGTHVKHCKNTSSLKPMPLLLPKTIILPMNMHIGSLASPIVNVNDYVYVGQKVAEATGKISSPVYSSVSGKVKKIENILASNGSYVPAIFIESDGLQKIDPALVAPNIDSYESFVEALKKSGIVGLGGAGFPTYVKFDIDDLSKVEVILINAAECEPFITSDTRTMIDDIDDLESGLQILEKYFSSKKIVFGIENNKPEAIQKLKTLTKVGSNIEIKVLPSIYPQGGEKVLIYNTLKKVVPEGKLPLDVGVIIINVTTLANIAKYIKTGMPLIEKVVTVDGSAVKTPKNVIALVGTPIKELFAFCDGFKEKPFKVMYGGPMMGVNVPSLDVPVLKTTNAVLAFNEKDAKLPDESNCIRCGRCINHCPLRLDPPAFAKALEESNMVELEKLKVNLCMECGVCSYVCPAKRRLVQKNRLAKGELRKYLTEKAKQKEEAK